MKVNKKIEALPSKMILRRQAALCPSLSYTYPTIKAPIIAPQPSKLITYMLFPNC